MRVSSTSLWVCSVPVPSGSGADVTFVGSFESAFFAMKTRPRLVAAQSVPVSVFARSIATT